MKVEAEVIQQVLQKHKLDPDLVRRIYDEVIADAESKKAPRSSRPKKPFVLVVSDPRGLIPEGTELVGWAVQIDEEKGIKTLPESLQRVAQDFNASKKGQKLPAESLGDVFEAAAAKQFAEHGVYRRHKEAVFMIVTDNKVIKDDGED